MGSDIKNPPADYPVLSNVKSGVTFDYGKKIGTYSGTNSSEYGIPKTGQTASYTTGDDGDYEKGYPTSGDRFLDNSDGTVTDQATGLMWVQDGTSSGCYTGGTLLWADAITFSEGLSFAGHTDWRLPNINELLSLVDYGITSGAVINQTFFPNTQLAGFYGSSTTHAVSTDMAWRLGLSGGSFAGWEAKDSMMLYVRPVRDN